MPHSYAIVPAAGRSRRMGAPKLLLPWPTKQRPHGLLIDQILAAWSASVADRIVVVVRRDDSSLLEACQKWDVDLLTPPDPPPDMTSSIQAGLQHVATEYQPSCEDGCFIAPSDLPNLSTEVVNGLWREAQDRWPDSEQSLQCVWTPMFGNDSGHPALLPWPACAGIFTLPAETGVDTHVRSLTRRVVRFPSALANTDCDTPSEYRAARLRADRLE